MTKEEIKGTKARGCYPGTATLETALKAIKATQTLRMEQVHAIRKSYGSEEAVTILLTDYNELCAAQQQIESILKTSPC